MRWTSNSATRWRRDLTELGRSDAKAVVLTGQGTMFSAGVDLKRYSADGADYIRKFLPALHRLYDAAFNLPKPLVAAINGHAIAGGAVLTCLRRPPHHGARQGPHRHHRIAGRRAVSGARLRGRALCRAAPLSERIYTRRRDLRSRRRVAARLGRRSGRAGGADGASNGHRAPIWRAVAAGLRADEESRSARQWPSAIAQKRARRPTRQSPTIWTAPATLGFVRDYVARTLKK